MENILKQVIDLVKEASLIITNQFEVHHKGHKENYVTSIDLKVQSFLNQSLIKIIDGSVVYGEENETNELFDNTWIVDPIDGTANLVHGVPNFAISIGLYQMGEIVLGVVYSPHTNEMYHAIKGHGSYLNGKKLQVSNKPFGKSLFCTSMSIYDKSNAPVCFDIIKEVYDKCSDVRRFGSCALELCYLAAGRVELYFEYNVNPWDFSGGLIILSEAGGFYGTIHQNQITFDQGIPLIAANTKENFNELKQSVDKYIK